MTKQVQRRRGTATQHTSFTGAEGEISVNTTNKSVHVHDGVTTGGIEAARADMTNVTEAAVSAALAGATNVDINGGSIDGTVIGANSAAAITGTTITASTSITGTLATAAQPNITSVGSLTSLDVAGSVTADGLTVDGDVVISNPTTSQSYLRIEGQSGNLEDVNFAGIEFYNTDPSGKGPNVSAFIEARSQDTIGQAGQLVLATAPIGSTPEGERARQRMRINSAGDIQFYEDTGTTPKLTWDASAERLGVGTSSPSAQLELSSATDYSGLKVSGTNHKLIAIETSTSNRQAIASFKSGSHEYSLGLGTSDEFSLYDNTNSSERLRIDSSGNVGIGTSSFSYSSSGRGLLEVNGSTSALMGLKVNNVAGGYLYDNGTSVSIGAPAGRNITFDINGEKVRITSSGSVGIGTSSPGALLHVKQPADNNGIRINHATRATSTFWDIHLSGVNNEALSFRQNNGSTTVPSYVAGRDFHLFYTSGSEAARIDSSGNLLVGKTVADNTTQGARIYPTGRMSLVSQADDCLILNRRTSDGDIVTFRKSGSTVASIGVNSTYPYFAKPGQAGIRIENLDITPSDSSGGSLDNFADLGNSSNRFKDLYLSGGVYLGGTGSANKLDDYEEGTFTPTIGGNGSNPTVTYSSQYGYYTKIGRMVYISLRVRASAYSGGSGSMQIGGLPFTPISGPQHNIGGTFSSGVSWGTGNTQLMPWAVDGQPYVRFRAFQNNTGNYDLFVGDYSAYDYLDVNGWYFV